MSRRVWCPLCFAEPGFAVDTDSDEQVYECNYGHVFKESQAKIDPRWPREGMTERHEPDQQ